MSKNLEHQKTFDLGDLSIGQENKASDAGMRIRSDPVIFGPPDPVLFPMDPDSDPTCNNGVRILFSSWTKFKPESRNLSIKWWFIISNFMPTYLKYKYIFFLHFDFRSDPEFFSSWAGSGSVEKKFRILIPGYNRPSFLFSILFGDHISPYNILCP